MTHGEDPSEYFLPAVTVRRNLEEKDEPMSKGRFEDIVEQGTIRDHDQGKVAIYQDSSFDINTIRRTMCNLYMDDFSRRGRANGRIAERGVVMSAESTTDLSLTICFKQRVSQKVGLEPHPNKCDT